MLTIQTPDRNMNLLQLAGYLEREYQDRLGFMLIDRRQLLTAEFIVNGKHIPNEQMLKDGDQVTVIPAICGG